MLRVVVLWACVAASLAAPPVGRVTSDAASSLRDADVLGARRFDLAAMKTKAATNYKAWNDALATKNEATVTALYSTTAGQLSFLPTVSPVHIKDQAGTKDYFKDFVKKNPAGTITDELVQKLTDDAYLHTGDYTFKLGDIGAQADVKARFSYVWKNFGTTAAESWKIVHHHSSATPPAPAARRSAEGEAADTTTLNFAQEKILGATEAVANTASLPTSRRTTPAIAQENYRIWNAALQTKNATTVAALYSAVADQLSFLPTVEPKHCKAIACTTVYFEKFVKNNPYGIITDELVQPFGTDHYLHSGLYTFFLGEKMSQQAATAARFSYVWKKYGNDWKIIHHHSSVQPNGIISLSDLKKLGQENFKMWNDALATKDPKKVAALYSVAPKELSFLPTVSPSHIKDTAGTEKYFEDFVKKNPVGTISDEEFQMFDSGTSQVATPRVQAYLHTGMYTFMLEGPDGKAPTSARFSYMWKKYPDGWKITHHHSSVVPGAAGATSTIGMQKYIAKLAIAAVAMATLAAVAALAAAFKAFASKPPSVTIPPAPAPPPPLAPVPTFVSSEIAQAYSQPFSQPMATPVSFGYPPSTQEPFIVGYNSAGPISVSSRY